MRFILLAPDFIANIPSAVAVINTIIPRIFVNIITAISRIISIVAER